VIKPEIWPTLSLVPLVALLGGGTLCPMCVCAASRWVLVPCAMCWMCTCEGHWSEKKLRQNQKFLSWTFPRISSGLHLVIEPRAILHLIHLIKFQYYQATNKHVTTWEEGLYEQEDWGVEMWTGSQIVQPMFANGTHPGKSLNSQSRTF